MTQKNTEPELMIQLPWTVPQNVQTIVIQPPAKTHMELNASTDKTAISSFSLSVIVALILGGFATWLAYWYGRRSFKLTKMSFDIIIRQIMASEQSALDLNKKLFEQQLILQNQHKHSEMQKNIIGRFRYAAEKFTIDAELYLSSITLLHLSHEQLEFPEKMGIGSYEYEVFIKN